MIAERYSRKGNFVNYSFREDMVAAATLNLCNNALKFDTNKYNNPFSYYTTAIHHSFLQYIAEEKKHREIRDKLLIDAGSNPSHSLILRRMSRLSLSLTWSRIVMM
jgi:DNA-directed RNA polymerase specialized sigma subunit